MQALRVKPFRGDTVAAGAVVLATVVVLLAVREDWSRAGDVAMLAAAGAFVGLLAVLSPVEGGGPRVYQTVLFLSTLALLAVLVERLGGGGGEAVAWKAAVVAVAAAWFARERGSGTCVLVAALAAGVAALALADAAGWDSGSASRRILLALTAVYALAAVAARDRRPRAAAMLAVAGGTATLAIAATFLVEQLLGLASLPAQAGVEVERAGAGWELLLVAAGFGLCAYSGVERQPGPGYLGVLNLVAFVALAADGSGAGWPLALAAGALALLAIGLRPAQPLPPPPDAHEPPGEALPLRR